MNLTLTGALVAGLATSLHCAGMCGPLACSITTTARHDGERLTAASAYHLTRLLSYTILGAIAGSIGHLPLQHFFHSPAVLLPWALVFALLLLATGLDRKIPRPLFFQKALARARFRAQRWPVIGSASAMGLLTPFLPCGPLYAVLIALVASGSAAKGAETALAFGLGTVPLLWITQSQFHRLRLKLSPTTLSRVQRSLAAFTALLLAWRLQETLPFLPQNTSLPDTPAAETLPSCCHGS